MDDTDDEPREAENEEDDIITNTPTVAVGSSARTRGARSALQSAIIRNHVDYMRGLYNTPGVARFRTPQAPVRQAIPPPGRTPRRQLSRRELLFGQRANDEINSQQIISEANFMLESVQENAESVEENAEPAEENAQQNTTSGSSDW